MIIGLATTDPLTRLQVAFENYCASVRDDRGTREYKHQIGEALHMLSLLAASPGRRAAIDAMPPNHSGQATEGARRQEPMRAQGGSYAR